MTQASRRLHDLAPSQIPEWFAYQVHPESAVYNISFNHFFMAKIDPAIFLKTWQDILDRHDVFRIRMAYADGKPKQFLSDRVVLRPETLLIDRTALDADKVAAEQEELARHHALKPFDFDGEALFRLHLVAYPDDEYQLIFTVHHIIWDESSTMNLIREFAARYTAHSEGRSIDLPPLPSSFLDYADRVNHALAAGHYARHQAYWQEQFASVPGPLNLPVDHPRPALQTYNGNTVKTWLPRAVTRDIQHFCASHNTTLFILLLSVLDVYLSRVCGQDDFVLGCPIAGRGSADKGSLGCFAVPMPIRCRVAPDMTFEQLLRQVTETVLGAFEHYHYPCVTMIEQMQHHKDLSRPKLFSVMAGVQNNKSEFISIPLGAGSLYAKEIYSAENHGARFDLAIGMDPVGSDIKFFCTYNSDLFEEDTVTRLLDDLTALFSRVLADPRQTLVSYPLLSDATMHTVLSDFNRTEVARDDVTVIDWIDQHGRNQPHAVALDGVAGQLSYAELSGLSAQLAGALLSAGVSEQDRVGVLLEPGTELIAGLLAIMRIGAVYVPLNEEWPQARLDDVAAQVDFKVVLSCDRLAQRATSLAPRVLLVEHCTDAAAAPAALPASRARPDGIAYILFTSGSTGQPKGIPIQHRGLFNLIASTQARYRLTAADRMLFWTACSFDASLLDICWPLACGAGIVVWPAATLKSPDTAIEIVDRHGVTVLQTVPVMLDALCDARLRRPGRSTLRLIICGAAALRRSVSDRAAEVFGCRLANHYGPTEATVDALWFDCAEPVRGEMVPVGTPLPNVKVFVLDENDEPLPIGATGNLCIASPGLSPGYWRAPELTAAAFFHKALTPGAAPLRLYRSGDLAKFDSDGVLHFAGRKDNQVKVHGNRVELGEIESALQQHPAVAQAVVLFQQQGDGDGRLKAVVELRDHATNRFAARGKHYRQYTVAQQPWMRQHMNLIHHDTWPRYFEGSPALARHWEQLYAQFPAYQFCLLDDDDHVVCVANGVPLFWDGSAASLPEGWDEGVALAFRQQAEGIAPNTILGLAGIVASHCQGLGLSNKIVEGFRALVKMHGLDQFLGPVRPVGMLDHGKMDVFEWAQARDAQGEPLDFWLRVHERLGATTLGVAPRSQLVHGTLQDWQRWTGACFDASGAHTLPDTLQSVQVDVHRNEAVYYDPSIWVGHYRLREAAFGIERHIGVAELREHLGAVLPAYLLPDEISIVSRMPMNENGKIDTRALSDRAPQAAAASTAARSPIQLRLLDIWQDTLQREGIGIDHDFFSLGGQSLKVIDMLSRVEKSFQRKIKVRDFYRQPTIYHLERLIGSHSEQGEQRV